jgi:hypothetical protein
MSTRIFMGNVLPQPNQLVAGDLGYMLSLLARGIPVTERADRVGAGNLIRKLNYRRKREVMGAGTQDRL